MTRLCEIVAIEKGTQGRATKDFTEAHRLVQQADRMSGISRTYQPRDEDGEKLPPESTRVQYTTAEVNAHVAKTLSRLVNLVATKDIANTQAVGRVEVEGMEPFVAPVSFLLWLEKRLVDVRTYVAKLPTLDPAFSWSPDPASGGDVYRTEPVNTTRTRKTPHNHVLAEATPEHPAQVSTYMVDEVVGDWTTVRFSGAVLERDRRQLIERVDRLADAVKSAREAANSHTIGADSEIGDTVFAYLFS